MRIKQLFFLKLFLFAYIEEERFVREVEEDEEEEDLAETVMKDTTENDDSEGNNVLLTKKSIITIRLWPRVDPERGIGWLATPI